MADHPRNHRDSRSRSPRRHHSHHHRTRSPTQHKRNRSPAALLPFNSRQLTKHDVAAYWPMFALYLDIQKGKVLEDMDEKEIKGRWKSFIGKWNRGELSEGWYDPGTLQQAVASASAVEGNANGLANSNLQVVAGARESDDEIGPTLPGRDGRARSGRMGPSVPNIQDLELRREMDQEDGLARRDDIRFARRADRKEQKAALDELLPRAEAGTRERQLEKKKELNEKMKSFRERSPGPEVPDTELMGGGDGLESYKKEKQEFERKKNERELRKEETLRARTAEREERLQEYRAKEEETMEMLKALAKQRFG